MKLSYHNKREASKLEIGVYHALLFNYLVNLARFLITGCGSDTQPTTTSPAPDNGTRLALLIGNDNYDENANKLKLGALDNPVNDARDMAKALKGLGYQVILRTNVNKTAFNRAVRDFRQFARALILKRKP
ncbi:MAG: caspase family protein [Pseudomonadota bacterium]